ncbi:MAG: sigma-54-dependent Fis family transcriptional regulator [Spirochaetes bacterium]|nr:sigma-54-dependent Fis family transcriptional regulator [Spirochaetota bacterium]
MNKRILVVDDEEIQANIISNILEKENYFVKKAYSAEEAMKVLSKNDFHVLLVDLMMPGIGGMGLLKSIKEKGLESSFIIMTAYGTIESAVEAMKEGAFDYITKPFSKDELLINIEKAVKAYNLYEQNIHLREELKSIYEERKIIGSSKETKKVNELIEKVSANESVNVLITGESGTGKELVAREIHTRSGRADMPFVPVNCSAIPETLMESELFGYEKGAFTGAVAKREGKFKRANGGTIFLDEIADMAMSMQVKLLRVIQDKEVVSVGGDEPIKVDIRIISATNRDIEAMVEKGNFRDDLYYRLNVVPIHIPPLRERRDDITVLVDYIIEKLNKKLKKNVSGLSGSIMSKLMSYNFPGNIRELENMLERAYILAGNDRLRIEHFPILSSGNNEIEVFSKVKALKAISGEARKRAEKNAIERALIETNWNRVKAAKLLKVDYKTLRRKMKELDIYPHYNDERSE